MSDRLERSRKAALSLMASALIVALASLWYYSGVAAKATAALDTANYQVELRQEIIDEYSSEIQILVLARAECEGKDWVVAFKYKDGKFLRAQGACSPPSINS